MVLLVILDAIQNESNFRLFSIVKMVNLRSGGPFSLLVWRLGEKDPWYFMFFPFPEKKKACSKVRKQWEKYAAVFFPLEVFEKHLIVCDRNTLNLMWKLKSRIL